MAINNKQTPLKKAVVARLFSEAEEALAKAVCFEAYIGTDPGNTEPERIYQRAQAKTLFAKATEAKAMAEEVRKGG